MTRFSAIRGDREPMRPRGHEANGTLNPFRRQRDQRRARRHSAARSESAAHEARLHAHIVRLHPELARDAAPETVNELTRLDDGEPVARPETGRVEQLER